MSTSSLNIAGVILAGGKSSRMGQDKSAMLYRGIPLINCMENILSSAGLPVWISGKCDKSISIPDKLPHLGPLSGIFSSVIALHRDGYQGAVFVPVDMPLLTAEIILMLMSCPQRAEAVCFRKKPLPLLIYFTDHVINTLSNFEKKMMQNFSIKHFLDFISLLELEVQNELAFTNVNTPSDWEKL